MAERATLDLVLNEEVIEEWTTHYNHPLILNSSSNKDVAARYDIWKVNQTE